ncbi:MAG TPA: C40 family peptidase [Candidatus Saccharimonadales bacterium]|nr:C40 family peptidase [Candidatus Saccharimonadales bacterium]
MNTVNSVALGDPIRVPIVRPERSPVARGTIDLRAEPDAASELVDQALFGEELTILGRQGGWVYAQGEDGYFGWAPATGLGPPAPAGTGRMVVVHGAVVRAAPDPAASAVDTLAPGTIVEGPAEPGWLRCAGGWLAESDTLPLDALPARPPVAADLLATAATFLGVPYLWGGLTARGIDCSGLIQQVYRLNGVALPRDADQQALSGRAVTIPRDGDLVFFGEAAVTHTAIATGPETFFHAPKKGGFVEPGALGDGRRVLAIRRFLP